jgi:hypothetical protein
MSKEDNQNIFDETEIKEEPKKKRGRQPGYSPNNSTKTNKVEFSADECTAKIFQVYNIIGRFKKSDRQRLQVDFIEEGTALSRISGKYPIVSTVLKLFDPLFLLIGIINKFSDHFPKKPKKVKEVPINDPNQFTEDQITVV